LQYAKHSNYHNTQQSSVVCVQVPKLTIGSKWIPCTLE